MRGAIFDEAAGEKSKRAVGIIICFQRGDVECFGCALLLLFDAIFDRSQFLLANGEIDHCGTSRYSESKPLTFAGHKGAPEDPCPDGKGGGGAELAELFQKKIEHHKRLRMRGRNRSECRRARPLAW